MTISFIIPVYNGERYISACLYSLLKQTYTDWQAILINDGSTDNSLSVLQSFAKSDSRFVVYSQNNQGVAIARNRGIKEAQGEYIGSSNNSLLYTFAHSSQPYFPLKTFFK